MEREKGGWGGVLSGGQERTAGDCRAMPSLVVAAGVGGMACLRGEGKCKAGWAWGALVPGVATSVLVVVREERREES